MPGLIITDHASAWTATPQSLAHVKIPSKLSGSLVWSGTDFADGVAVVELSEQDVEELERGLNKFKSLEIPREELRRETFPLDPALAQHLEKLSVSVHDGRGFAVLRGVDPAKYSDEDTLLLFAGVSSYVGDERQGMDYIYNAKPRRDTGGPQLRPPNLPVAMNFHTDTDSGDITALYIQNKARYGGDQRLASISKVYNELQKTNPEAIHTLMENWRFEVPWGNGTEVINRPLLYHHDSHLLFTFAKSFIRGSTYDTRLPDCPPLTHAQEQALSLVLQSCEKHSLKLDSKRGDMLFINNLAVLHQRDAFIDDAKTGQTRFLLSLRLKDPRRAWKQPLEIALFTDARFAAADARALPSLREWRALRFGRWNESDGSSRSSRTPRPFEKSSPEAPLRAYTHD